MSSKRGECTETPHGMEVLSTGLLHVQRGYWSRSYRRPMAYASTNLLLERLQASPAAWSHARILEEFSIHTLTSALKSRKVTMLLPRVYVGACWSQDFRARLSATAVWCGNHAVATGLTAAYIYGWVDVAPGRLEVLCDHSLRFRAPRWLRIRRTRLPFIRGIHEGYAVATPAEALLCCWNSLPLQRATGFVIDAVRERRVRIEDFDALIRVRKRVPRRRELEELVGLLATGVESYLEFIAATEVFTGPEFDGFTRQHRVRKAEHPYKLDFYSDAAKLSVELDGGRYHSGDDARRRDIQRDADLASLGILTMRFSFQDITRRGDWCRRKVLDAVRNRTPS